MQKSFIYLPTMPACIEFNHSKSKFIISKSNELYAFTLTHSRIQLS